MKFNRQRLLQKLIEFKHPEKKIRLKAFFFCTDQQGRTVSLRDTLFAPVDHHLLR